MPSTAQPTPGHLLRFLGVRPELLGSLQALEGHYLRGYGDRTQQVMKLSPITSCPARKTKNADGSMIIPTAQPTGSRL